MFNTSIFENGQEHPDVLNAPQPIDITSQRQASIFNTQRFRRESIAHSQGMGGVSWGSVTIGLWLKDEVMMFGQSQHMPRRGLLRLGVLVVGNNVMSMLPPNAALYLPNLEADYCKDYSCCGQLLPTLHDLLRHYEEAHISALPPLEPNVHFRRNMNSIHNVMETVSTTDVFLNNQPQAFQTLPPAVLQPEPTVAPQLAQRRKDDMYIDDPARHLYVAENEEYKPYKCPVIGCEKTYKNQNGLKYHRLHGHQNQKLKENDDGTFSIIDPELNTPYLDGAGMEKDKPYRCEVCGKRYKNLNGLKYHRGHTTH